MKKNKLCLSFLMFISAIAWSSPGALLELIDFSAIQSGNKVDIKWRTSIETGGPYFTIEKSRDGKEYTKVVDLPATEIGSAYADYFETDYQPYSGVSYYRVKQTDEAGNFRYSQTVILKVEESTNSEVYTAELYNNSTNDQSKQNEILLVLRDAGGNDFYSKAMISSEKNKLFTTNLLSKIPVGTYRIVGSSDDELYSNTLIVK